MCYHAFGNQSQWSYHRKGSSSFWLIVLYPYLKSFNSKQVIVKTAEEAAESESKINMKKQILPTGGGTFVGIFTAFNIDIHISKHLTTPILHQRDTNYIFITFKIKMYKTQSLALIVVSHCFKLDNFRKSSSWWC